MGNTTNSQQKSFHLEEAGGKWAGSKLWTLTFDMPGEKVNKLSKKSMSEFEALIPDLEALGKEGRISALIFLSGKPGNFIAGADIEMIQATQTEEEARDLSRSGQKLFERWEDLPFPTIAAVEGAALGGGCEFCMASSAIVMSNDPAAKIGVPELMLGVIPGAGGCVRIPRKVGIATGLDLILTSKTLSGERAVKTGLVEACLPKENFKEAVLQWAQANLKALHSGKRLAKEPKLGGMGGTLGTLMEKTPFGRALIFKKAREGVLSKTRGKYPAPIEAISVIQKAGGGYGPKVKGEARTRAMETEAQAFGKCAATEVSKNLIRIFYLTEGVKKSKGLPAGSTSQPQAIKTAAVLGAGVMGGGIAQLFAERNIPARMKDLNAQALALGIQAATKIFKKQVETKRMTRREFQQKLNLIAPVTDYSGFHSTDLVIEAIVENMEIKQKVLKELEGQVKDDCVIATNTSSLSVSGMQDALSKPERFVGMHFFNPVNRMPLVEVIRGQKTSDSGVSTIFQLSKQLGKTPIVVKDSPGFLVNRLLAPYMIEGAYILAEGMPIPEMDKIVLDFGMPMGPMELIDEVGIDVANKVAHVLHEAFGARMLPNQLLDKLVAQGMLGKKKAKGLYSYEAQGKKKVFDSKVYEVLGITPHAGAVSADDVIERLFYPMINEACRCLEEGVVASPAEVDLGMIMGTGFPPFRGGLLRYADTLGAKAIVAGLKKYQPRFGARFEPCSNLLTRAEHDQKFYPV